MTSRRGILSGGNWVIDHVKIVDVWPQQDALANILSESESNGGAPFNILINLAKLGASFPLEGAGLVGNDAGGRWIVDVCQKHQISTQQLHQTDRAATSYTDVMSVEKGGRRTFFHRRGANAFLGPEHFAFDKTSCKIFHLGYLLLLDRLDQIGPHGESGASQVLAAARQAGLLTSVDLVSEDSHRFSNVVQASLRQTDICFLNEFEAERTTGIRLRDGPTLLVEQLPQAATALLDLGVRQAVVLHFAEGGYLRTTQGEVFTQGSVCLPPGQILGAAGAGDAFAAGFLLAWHDRASWIDALHSGICAAASCLTHSSCSGGIRRQRDCLALGQKFGFQKWNP